MFKAHLELLRHSVHLDSNSSSGGGGSQSQTIGRLKNLMCQWGSCKMGLSRGNFQKQVCLSFYAACCISMKNE